MEGIFLHGLEITEENLLKKVGLFNKYFLSNYEPGKLLIFYSDGGGVCGEINSPLADKLGKIYDSWNYEYYNKKEE